MLHPAVERALRADPQATLADVLAGLTDSLVWEALNLYHFEIEATNDANV